MSSDNGHILSCDDPGDAVRSLAIIYGVKVDRISEVVEGGWPGWIVDSTDSHNDTFKSELVPFLMGCTLGVQPTFELGEIAYYHRASYDGSSDWFAEGLLASSQGAKAYLQKVSGLISDLEGVEDLAQANIQERSYMEGESGGGPYAFDVFDDAKGADRPGLSYRVPEFFCGGVWANSNEGVHFAVEICEILERKTKSVVVKFKATTVSPEVYITNLWHYLYRVWVGEPMTSCSHYPSSFSGGGKNVPAENIINLIDMD